VSVRRVPRWSEFANLLRPQPLEWSRTRRRLRAAASVRDLRDLARRRAPRAVFDYTDGGADAEISLRRSREAFARVEFVPRILRDVSSVDTSTVILGVKANLPMIFAPTGFTRMMHHQGEPAVGRVAERVGIPYVLSTLATTSPEDLATAVPDGDNWFQLYIWRDRAASRELLDRVAAAGYRVLVLTVDAPVAGARLRDARNGLTIPPSITLKTFLDAAAHPAWWLNLLTTEPLRFASLNNWNGTVAELMNKIFDPGVTIDDLDWLRGQWPGPLVIKGIQTVDDATTVVNHGADAVVISNHGGRQLDRAPVPLEQLPRISAAVGDRAEVYIDGGIMAGSDLIAAIAYGARACLVGRAYLYGLMAGGEPGVQRAADLLHADARRTMQLLGVSHISGLNPGCVRFLRSGPQPQSGS
jgi:L-lactate dehydrogenase (cytochrome)